MRKAFILDTNVLLFDPQALFKFGHNDIVIPIVVIEEIDRFKREMSENGRHARLFSRLIDDMRADGELSKGVKLPNGGILTIELGTSSSPLPMELQMEKADNRILALAISLKKEHPKRPIVFVTKDINLRIKADALGISAEDYEPSSVEPEHLYSGTLTLSIDSHRVDEFYQNKRLTYKEGNQVFKPNQYVILKDLVNPNHTAMGRFSKELDCVV